MTPGPINGRVNTASFYAPTDWSGQAYRVSRQHPRGRRVQWDSLPFLYPDLDLFRAYRRGDLDFAGLAGHYLQRLEEKFGRRSELHQWIMSVPAQQDFTLLCFEPAGQPCHRQILAQWLLDRVPGLKAGSLR